MNINNPSLPTQLSIDMDIALRSCLLASLHYAHPAPMRVDDLYSHGIALGWNHDRVRLEIVAMCESGKLGLVRPGGDMQLVITEGAPANGL